MKISQTRTYIRLLLMFTFCLPLLEGCANTVQQVPRVEPSELDSSKVIIRLIRDSQILGGGGNLTVIDNEKTIGRIGSGGELKWQREPGEMRLDLKAMFGDSIMRSIYMDDTIAGKVYTFRITITLDGVTVTNITPSS